MAVSNVTSAPENILIACAGLGMGNASRVAAIMEALNARRNQRAVSFHVVTWGSAHRFLDGYKSGTGIDFELTEARSYRRAAALTNLRAYFKNVFLLRALVKSLKPRLIILDSDYHFPAYFGCGCPIVYVGQATDVLERASRGDYRPASLYEKFNFFLRERLDSLVQGFFASWVLVPCFTADGASLHRVKKIPLIVRKEFLNSYRAPARAHSVGILLSGSGLESSAFLSLADKYGLKLLAPESKLSTVPSHADSLDQFEIIFTQGGLSSISECIARAKFIVVFPLSSHPEQMLNAVAVENLGLGMRSKVDELSHFPEFLNQIFDRRALARASTVRCNGADVAADFIFSALSGDPAI